MSKQLAGMAIIGIVFGVSAKAEPIEGGKNTPPEGIHCKAGTRLRVVCYNAYWTSTFPRDDGELRSSRDGVLVAAKESSIAQDLGRSLVNCLILFPTACHASIPDSSDRPAFHRCR